ncbi:MAG: AraC family transcriptional regulator [Pseudomonadota bacterium]
MNDSLPPTGADGLAAFRLFSSHDLEETRARVAAVFKPHELRVRGARQSLDARMDHLPVGSISINRLGYGADVSIEPDRLEHFVLVQWPLRGTADIECGRQRIRSTPALASVLTPTQPLRMRWSGECDQLIVRIERAALERACSNHLGHELRRPIEFDLGMDLAPGHSCKWRHLMAFLAADPDFLRSAAESPLVRAQIEQLVMCTLLTEQPHNYREELLRPVPAPAPYFVRRAEEYMLHNADKPVTMQDLAAHAGTSTRSLFAGFRAYRGTSPMAYLRDIRLQRVREDLLRAAQSRESVTEIALRWGFSQLGRFAARYKEKFGETPSQTLRR